MSKSGIASKRRTSDNVDNLGLVFGPESKCDARCPAKAITTITLITGKLRFCGHHFFNLEIPDASVLECTFDEDFEYAQSRFSTGQLTASIDNEPPTDEGVLEPL